MEEWLKIIIPIALGFIGSVMVAGYNAKSAAQRAANAESAIIRTEREKTRQSRDLEVALVKRDIEDLKSGKEKSDVKIDRLFDGLNDLGKEVAKGFAELGTKIDNIKEERRNEHPLGRG